MKDRSLDLNWAICLGFAFNKYARTFVITWYIKLGWAQFPSWPRFLGMCYTWRQAS